VNMQVAYDNRLSADIRIENKALVEADALGEEWIAMVAGGTPVVNAL
jgi:hypothetical protein